MEVIIVKSLREIKEIEKKLKEKKKLRDRETFFPTWKKVCQVFFKEPDRPLTNNLTIL